jgi:D-alanyl-D-alanine dipeptidase
MFKELEKYRQSPIQNLDGAREVKKGYRLWGIDANNPLYKEVCVDVRGENIAGANHYYGPDNPPYYQRIPGSTQSLFLRTGVFKKLLEVNERLCQVGFELFVHDAWRPAAVQYYFHNVWFPGYLNGCFPTWSTDRISQEVDKYFAFGPARQEDINPLSPPPHSTGAAVDLTIRKIGGDALWMGTIFDDVTARSHTDFLEKGVDSVVSLSDDEARKNRRLLYWVMTEAGFINNPTEWWHFSWGDQMWAKLTSAASGVRTLAWYSVINPF